MATLKSELVLALIDHLSGPAKKAGGSLDGIGRSAKTAGQAASKEMQTLANSLKKTADQAKQLDLFKGLQKDLPAARQAFRSAQSDVQRLGNEISKAKKIADSYDGIKAFSKNGGIAKEMADARKKVSDLEREMTRAQRTVTLTGDAFKRQADAVLAAKRSLTDMGVNLKSVGSAESALKSKIDATTAAMKRQVDMENTSAAAAERSAQRRERAGRAYQVAAALSTGTIAAGHFIAQPVKKAMGYDEQITYTGLTLAGGGSIEEKRGAKQRVSDTVYGAQRYGGGKREDVARAYNEIVGMAGTSLNEEQMGGALRESAKTAHATGADAADAGKAAVAMMNNGVKESELKEAFDVMVRGGELGGFEFPDMSKWFSSQLAMGSSVGLQGLEGVRKLTAWNQAARTVAANADEAGNNMINILQKLGSKELVDRLAKDIEIQSGDPYTKEIKGKGKRAKVERKFDWNSYKLKEMKKGIDPMTAVVGLIDRELEKDRAYKTIKGQLDNAKTPEDAKALLGQMGDIAVASKFGAFFSDRQAFMGAYAIHRNRDKINADIKELESASGTVDVNSQVVREQAWSKAQESQNELDRANELAYRSLEGPLGALTESINDAARAFPEFTAGLYAGSNILAALGAGGLVGGAASILVGGSALTGSAAALDGSAAALTAAAAKLGGTPSPWGAQPSAPAPFPSALGLLPPGAMAALQIASTIERAGAEARAQVETRTGSVRDVVGDDALKQARDKHQPLGRRLLLMGAPDPNDGKYVRKHLLDGVKESTAGWPDAATDGIARYTQAIAQGGREAVIQADAIATEIEMTLSLTGTPNVDTSKIQAALNLAKQLGQVLHSLSSSSVAAPTATPAAAAPVAIDGARAKGGPTDAGGTYLVGEEGPELFTPKRDGTIIPAGVTKALKAATAGAAALAVPTFAPAAQVIEHRLDVPDLPALQAPELTGRIQQILAAIRAPSAILDSLPPPPEPPPIPSFAMAGPAPGEDSRRGQGVGAGAAQPVSHTFHITMNVNGVTDPEKVAQQVRRQFNDDASRLMRAHFSDGII